ncbi:uncharacterized protein LOC144706370 [Wolffia australiana]
MTITAFFVFLFLRTASGLLDPVDFLVLQSVRSSLEDMPGSHFFASWDFSRDPCFFSGVFCSGDRVVALSLGDPRAGSPGLFGHLDPSIGDLTALAELTVVPGRLIGPLPPTLARLTNLKFLAMSRNFLSGTIPSEISSLRQLRTLDLSFNLLSGAIPAGLGLIRTLSNVVLCHNRLSGSVPSLCSASLVRLDLSNNDLSGGISCMPDSLQHLSLSQNRLSGSIDRVISRNQRLNFLDLSLNLFSGGIPPRVFSFPMRGLFLQRNLFTGPLRPAAEVTIPTVDVSFNRLWGGISPFFSSVRRLYLNNNLLSGAVPAQFVAKLMDGEIEILYLQHNYLTGIQVSPASELPRRSSFCVQYNCMLPPSQMSCPFKAGREKIRPASQCVSHRG